jgi:hypothetical protein
MTKKRQQRNVTKLLVQSDENGEVKEITRAPVRPSDMPETYARCLMSGLDHVVELNQTQLRVLCSVIKKLDKDTGRSPTTQKAIADETGIKPPHVSTAIKALINGKFIQKAKYGNIDVFVVSPAIAVCGGYTRGMEIWLEAMPPSPKRDADLKACRQGRSKKVQLAFGTMTETEITAHSREGIAERRAREVLAYAAQRAACAA